jgi:hypothetical protein
VAYTGPFPHNNSGVTTAIIVSDKTFTGTLDNTGTIIAGSPASGNGILVENNSTINGEISNNGTIEVAGNGIIVAGTFNAIDESNVVSGIVNGAAGTITITNGSGDGMAVEFESKFSGGISNFGVVSAGGIRGAGLNVIGVSTFTGGVDNAGTIDAPGGISVFNDAHFSGGVTNTGPIDVETGDIGISAVADFAGNITNNGALTATIAEAIAVATVDFATGGTFSGTIGNSGVISAARTGINIEKVGLSLFSGGITNSGRITAATGFGVTIADVADAANGSFVGSIVNTGNIQSFEVGLDIAGDGTSSFDSVVVVGHGHHAQTTTGGISNSGAITSVNAAGISVTIIAVHGTFSGNIVNSGAISAKKNGIQIATLGRSAFLGGITNSGAITSTSGLGINIQGIAVTGAGDFTKGIVNSGKIVAKSTGIIIGDLANAHFSGGITNSGAITSSEKEAINIFGIATDGTFTNSIVNTGALTAKETALNISNVGAAEFSGSITNSGAITSTSKTAVQIFGVAGSGNFIGNIANSGAVSAKKTGIRIEDDGASRFSGNIINSGAISATTGAAFSIQSVAGDGTFSGSIDNTGAISAGSAGFEVDNVGAGGFSGSISNDGRIVSTSNLGIKIDSIAGSGKFSGSIVNAGSISAARTGMLLESIGLTFSGGVTNSGVISVEQNHAGLLVEDIPHLVGNIVNAATGTIVAPDGITIEDATIAGSVIDAGTILAAAAGISIDGASKVSAAGTAVDITGATLTGGVFNNGVIDGKVGIDVVSAHGVDVFDGGTIIGSGGTAVELKAAGDDFTLGENYVVSGAVVAAAGDALQLGGAGPASFNLAAVGTQYKGFTEFNVVGGTWTMSGSSGGDWNVDGGEMILSSGTLSNSNVASGGTMLISAGGTLETTSGGAAVIAGNVTDNGTILASGGIMEFDGATVSGGGAIEIGNGIVRIQGDGNENVAFNNGASGGLQIADDHADQNTYSGTVTGLGNPANGDPHDYIDLTSVTFVSGGTITGSYDTGNHILTVTSGGTDVASIALAGLYATSNFHFSSGVSDTVEIIDPAVHSGGHHHDHNPGHSANLGLLGNYIAGFQEAVPGGLLVTSVGEAEALPLAVHPHR